MKRKIVLSFLALFIVFLAGAALANYYIRTGSATLARLIKLHEIEDLRKGLLISIQTVQSDLYTVNTLLAQKVDVITDNVMVLEKRARNCSSCHHPPEIAQRLAEVVSVIGEYQEALSYYITASADRRSIERRKLDAASIGNRLLSLTEEMSIAASKKLEAMTAATMQKISRVERILLVTMLCSFVFAILTAVHLTRSVTRPISILVGATREIASGKLGTTVVYDDKTEFGELAKHFNGMSSALEESYTRLMEENAERRATEAALSKSEAFLNTIFDSIRDPFCILDKEYRIVRMNQAYADLKRKNISGLVGEVCYRALEGKDTACDDCVITRTFLSGDSCAKEKSVEGPDGMQIWLGIYTYPILDEAGKPAYVIEYIRDVTEQKRAEQALKESEERYALAARGANDGLWDWDLRTNSVYFSERWKTMLGYTVREIGNDVREWIGRIHPDDRSQVELKISAHIQDQSEQFESEYRILHKDGTYRWMLSRGLAVFDGLKNPQRMAGSQTDITARKTAEEQLLYDAFHDALTGLPNRALFMDRLQNVIRRTARRHDYLYAVLFLDIDRFKVINDSLGHSVGDRLLIEMGNRLSSCLRGGDTIARLGGDEFAVLLESLGSAADTVDVVERIQAALSIPFRLQEHEVYVSQSIGIAMKSALYEKPEEVLRDADIAMYQAKTKGKARYEFFDSSLHAGIVERLELEADLRRAVEQGEGLLMHYQPVVDLKTHSLSGFEALVRWNHPARGMIAPGQFIPLAEETGMILKLGDWIIREVCRQVRLWEDTLPLSSSFKVSINVSGKQFLQADFAERLVAILAETSVHPSRVAIELTESIIMTNIDLAAVTMQKLKDKGVQIQIDDFGTGYSSLSYLHHFPISALKIDRSFVQKMSLNGEDREIVRAIVSLAQNLNLEVIAEGIEEPQQLVEIKNLECRYGQGYLFCRPKAPQDVEALIGASGFLNVTVA